MTSPWSGTADGPGEPFEATRWSVVLAAGRDIDAPELARAALAQLCQTYGPPLFFERQWAETFIGTAPQRLADEFAAGGKAGLLNALEISLRSSARKAIYKERFTSARLFPARS